MKRSSKHKIKTYLLSFALLLPLFVAALTLPTPTASALTKQQCISKYGNIPGGTATQEQIDEMQADGCMTPDGPCTYDDTGLLGLSITCTILNEDEQLTKRQCINRFHKKPVLTFDAPATEVQLARNGCSKTAGGPCVVRAVPALIDCKNEFSAETLSCKKYSNAAANRACKKGYKEGINACENLVDRLQKACEHGAKEHFGENGLQGDEDIKELEPCGTVDGRTGDPAKCTLPCKDAEDCNKVTKYINLVINRFLAPLAILAVIIGIIWGAITYIISAGDPQKVAEGKNRITKALLGLVGFIFLYALLNWLIPGGLL